MLNKKEAQQIIEFLTIITNSAREMLDEVATYEALLQENKKEQQSQSALRMKRKKRARARAKASN